MEKILKENRQGERMMQIRKMTMADYENIYALWMSCTGVGLNNLDDSKEGIEKFLNRNPDTCFVAEEDGRIIGVLLAGNDGRRGYIYHTAVHPDCRNKGIGTKLVNTVMQALKDLGINKTALVVFKRNESGNAFWEKMGFTERHDISYRNRIINEMIRYDL